MKLVLFAIRDNIAEIFNKPFTDLNINSGIRAFQKAVQNEPQKADYTLYKLGELNQETGAITTEASAVKIMEGLEVKTPDNVANLNTAGPAHLQDQAI